MKQPLFNSLFQPAGKKVWVWAALGFLLVLLLAAGGLLIWRGQGGPALPHRMTAQPDDPRVGAIAKALQAAAEGREELLAFLIYDVSIDHVTFSDDGRTALVWLAMRERETGEVVAGEAGLALARLGDAPEEWKITLQADADWAQVLADVPEDLLSAEERAFYLPKEQKAAKGGQVFRGYKLPWPAGRKVRVSGSVGHVYVYKTCPTTCLYAFDFADGTNFPVVAARGGRVKYAVWQYPNGNTKHANYLVLEDTSTSPVTYQVYYHLAQDSIPPALRRVGAEVLQGQLIGAADDTGASTASHLHFHVHTNQHLYWGSSVDIVFDEVQTNGGRPRTCVEANTFPSMGSQCQPGNWYESANGDAQRPTGGIESPKEKTLVTTRKLTVKGWAKDDRELENTQFLMTYTGEWAPVGKPQSGGQVQVTLDLCKLGVPDGPFLLAVDVRDRSGKSSGPTGQVMLEKQFNCAGPTPTPTATPKVCQPGAEQVGLWAEENYRGDCQVLGLGEYAKAKQLGIGNNTTESLRVGAGVMALAYAETQFGGQEEVFLKDWPSLEGSVLGPDAISSLKVVRRPDPPAPAALSAPLGKDGQPLREDEAVRLEWPAAAGVEAYRSVLSGPDGWEKSRDWGQETAWKVGKLAAGSYQWTVWARNRAGESRAQIEFRILAVDQPPASSLVSVEGAAVASTAAILHWQVLEGEEDLDYFEMRYRRDGGEWTLWPEKPDGGARQMWFLAKTDGLYEFQVRGVDRAGNVEDFGSSVVQMTLETMCAGVDDNDGWQNAVPVAVGESWEENLCPRGDVDWVVFPAQAGRRYRFSAASVSGGAAVQIQLLATDHQKVLGEARAADFKQDASLEWSAPADGLYYLKIQPIHPNLAGKGVNYRLSIESLGQVLVPALACSGLTLPAAWWLVRLAWKRRREAQAKRAEMGDI